MEKLKFRKVGLLITVLSLITINILQGCTIKNYFSEKSVETSNVVHKNFITKDINAVVIQKNTLLSVSLNNKSENIILDSGGTFSRPLISPNRNFVAYLKNNTLYITNSNLKNLKIAENIGQLSFTWKDENNLLYSLPTGGLYLYNIFNKVTKTYLNNEFNYQNITTDKKGNIYAEKYKFYKKDNSDYISDYGVVLFNPITKEENLIIKSIPSKIDTNGTLGMYPVIIEISKDNKYLYIWKHPHSGSMAADGVEFATYDISNNKLIKYLNPAIISLAYRDNISINPKDSRCLALIYGAGREMSNNKHLVLLDALTGKFIDLLPKDQSAMTPNYLSDGKTIVYAASEEQKNTNYNLTEWLQNGKHHIYSIDTNTKKIKQLTSSPNYFDFSPKFISSKVMLFFRSDKNNTISLWKIENGEEIMLADSLIFYDTSFPMQHYYGHFFTELYTDIATKQ